MGQKIVSYKVAKAIKEVGYPQGGSGNCYNVDTGEFHYTSCTDKWLKIGDYIDAPTYLNVWLWLWTEKGIRLQPDSNRKEIVDIYMDDTFIYTIRKENGIVSPEDAIIGAIEYLIDNDLIK